jgi:hypothetical protein
MLLSSIDRRIQNARRQGLVEEWLRYHSDFDGVVRTDAEDRQLLDQVASENFSAFAERHPSIDLDQCLADAAMCGIQWLPVALRTSRWHPPGFEFVELQPYYVNGDGSLSLVGFSHLRFGLAVHDLLVTKEGRFTPQDIDPVAYAHRLLALIIGQYHCNYANSQLLAGMLVAEQGVNETYLAELLNYRGDTRLITDDMRRVSKRFREAFQSALHNLDFAKYFSDGAAAMLSLKLTFRRHAPETRHKGFGQSATQLLVYDANQGIPVRSVTNKMAWIPLNRKLQATLEKQMGAYAKPVLEPLREFEKESEQRGYRSRMDFKRYFADNKVITRHGLTGYCVKVLGPQKNIGRYVLNSDVFREMKSIARKLESYQSATELLENFNRNAVAREHGSRQQALALERCPEYAPAMVRFIFRLSDADSEDDHGIEPRYRRSFQKLYLNQTIAEATQGRDERWGPPMSHWQIVPARRMVIIDCDWAEGGTYDDSETRRRLSLDCSMSYRLRLAANILENGRRFLEKDIIHGDIKPANMYVLENQRAMEIQARLRKHGMREFKVLTKFELAAWRTGEQPLDGDFGTVWVGNTKGDVVPPDRPKMFTQAYTSYRYISEEGADLIELNREQHTFNYLVTATLIACGYVNDYMPEDKLKHLGKRFSKAGKEAGLANQAYRRSGELPEAEKEKLRRKAHEKRILFRDALIELLQLYRRDYRVLSPLFQQARDNRSGKHIWLRPRMLELMRGNMNPEQLAGQNREQLMVLLDHFAAVMREEADHLETFDDDRASREDYLRYMREHDLCFNHRHPMINDNEPVVASHEVMEEIAEGAYRSLDQVLGFVQAVPDYTVEQHPSQVDEFELYTSQISPAARATGNYGDTIDELSEELAEAETAPSAILTKPVSGQRDLAPTEALGRSNSDALEDDER